MPVKTDNTQLVRAAVKAITAMQIAGERFRVLKELQLDAPKDEKAMAELALAMETLSKALHGLPVKDEQVEIAVRDNAVQVIHQTDFVTVNIIDYNEIEI